MRGRLWSRSTRKLPPIDEWVLSEYPEVSQENLKAELKIIHPTKSYLQISVRPFVHPCTSSPCGPNSECRLEGSNYTCYCMPNFVGSPPDCRPECLSNSECASHLTCLDERCTDPCEDDICGDGANCHVKNHTPICRCPKNYTGDPFVACTPDAIASVPAVRKECVLNGDCPKDKACFGNKCIDPCIECGIQAQCDVTEHFPICTCAAGYTGEPLVACHRIPPPGKFYLPTRGRS